MLRHLRLLLVVAKLRRSRCVYVLDFFGITGWIFIWFSANFRMLQIQISFRIIIFHLKLIEQDFVLQFFQLDRSLGPYHRFFIIEVLSLLEVGPLLLNH